VEDLVKVETRQEVERRDENPRSMATHPSE